MVTKRKSSISFKKDKLATGLSAVGTGSPSTIIFVKKDGKKYDIGYISCQNRWNSKQDDNFGKWSVCVQTPKITPDDNPNCKWKWAIFKTRFETESEAREFVKKNKDKIIADAWFGDNIVE